MSAYNLFRTFLLQIGFDHGNPNTPLKKTDDGYMTCKADLSLGRFFMNTDSKRVIQVRKERVFVGYGYETQEIRREFLLRTKS